MAPSFFFRAKAERESFFRPRGPLLWLGAMRDAEETTSARLPRLREAPQETGRGRRRDENANSIVVTPTTLTQKKRCKCTLISLFSLLKRSKTRTHSSVGGAGLEGPAPSAIVKGRRWGEKEGRGWKKRKTEKKTRRCLSLLSLKEKRKVSPRAREKRQSSERNKNSLFSLSPAFFLEGKKKPACALSIVLLLSRRDGLSLHLVEAAFEVVFGEWRSCACLFAREKTQHDVFGAFSFPKLF